MLGATSLIRSFVGFTRLWFLKKPVTVKLTIKLSTMSQKKPFERLPKDVTPVNYKLKLIPDLLAFTFDGQERILLKVSKPRWYSMCIKISKILMYSLCR